MIGRKVAFIDSKTVTTLGENVHLGRNAGALESQIKLDSLIGRAFVVGGDGQKRRGRLFRYPDFWNELFAARLENAARINEDTEIGPAANLIGGVDGWIGAFVIVRAGNGREVAAGQKAHDADPLRIDMPFACFGAHHAHRALGIHQRPAWMFRAAWEYGI